jgi:hypothetical protein
MEQQTDDKELALLLAEAAPDTRSTPAITARRVNSA